MAQNVDELKDIVKKTEEEIERLTREYKSNINAVFKTTIKKIDDIVSAVAPAFVLDMDIGCVPKHDFGEEFELIAPGPEALTGRIKFTLIPYTEPNQTEVSGSVLRERIKNKGRMIGQRDGEKIVALQLKVPDEYRKNHMIPLPATIYRHIKTNGLFIPVLWRNTSTETWIFRLRSIDGNFSAVGRLLIPSFSS
jgi:hypothetical protein